MKKRTTKLILNRETLHGLENRQLGAMFGGSGDTSVACIVGTGCECQTPNCYPPTACLGTCSCSG